MSKWTCNGESQDPQYPSKPHPPITMSGDTCIECGLPKKAVGASTSTTLEKNNSKK